MATDAVNTIKMGKLVTGVTTKTPASNRPADSNLVSPLTSYFNKSIKDLRSQPSVLAAIRTLARIHPETSVTVSTITRLANTELRMHVYDNDHQLSTDGSNLLRSVITQMTVANDYTYGFDDRPSLNSVKESLLRSLPLTGASAVELVLDKQRLPFRMQPVSPETLLFRTTKSQIGSDYKIAPYQQVAGGKIDLDIPTFFYEAMDIDLTSAYPVSPLESAINVAINAAETLEDMRRAIKRSGHSRLMVKLLNEELMKAAPMELRNNPEKLQEWVENQRLAIKSELENISPESALVFFSTMEVEYLNSQIGGTSDYTSLVETLDGILATSLKIPLAVLGKRTSNGSQNTSSTESLLYLKMAQGLHNPVESIFSRMLTLALRLYGFQGYVKCKFDPIDLRPEIELAAFKAMEQAKYLERLSLGLYTDQEAAELLNTGPMSPTAQPLSGTGFYNASSSGLTAPSPNGNPAVRALVPDTPAAAGGKSNKKQ